MESGFIPKELLDNSRRIEIMHKKKIGKLSRRDKDRFIEEDDLKVKTKEIETAVTKKFNKEQHDTFKTAVDRLSSKRTSLSRKEIVTLIEEIRKPSKRFAKYRQSGHLVDEKLKYSYQSDQLSLFDIIAPETRQKIKDSNVEVKIEGIRLTPPQNKLVHALNLLLHKKSINNMNSKKEGFYSGNMPSKRVPYGDKDGFESAVIKFKLSELYKAYIGHDKYSGHDISYIKTQLHELEQHKVLIKYDRVKKVQKQGKTETLTDRIEDFQSLLKIISFIPDLTDEEKDLLDRGDLSIRERRGEIIIALNPIFTDQIDKKFIEFPVDTNRRIVIAAGGHNKVTASMITLMEWMLRELSAKRDKSEINEEKLPYVLGLEKYLKQGRKKLLNERIRKDIDAVKNLGVVLSAERLSNASGGYKWVFKLNSDYK